MEDRKEILTKDDTRILKGVAIILMFITHLWSPSRVYGGELKSLITIGYVNPVSYLGEFGNICVSFFFFLGGYGLYRAFEGKEYDVIGRLKSLYKAYWKVFLIFIPIAFLFFRNQPLYCDNYEMCDRYAVLDIRKIFICFLGFSNSLNFEWWFFEHYLIAVLTFPLVRYLANKHSNSVNVATIVVLSILSTNLGPALGDIESIGLFNENFLYTSFICQTQFTMACFWMGIAMAKGNLLTRLHESMEKHKLLNPVTDILAWLLLMIFREEVAFKAWDLFLVPMLIVTTLDMLNRIKLLRKGFGIIGQESTNMWLIHSFFCFYFYPTAKFVTASGWAIPSLLTLLIISYAASIAVTYFWKGIEFLYGKLFAKTKTAG